MKVSKTAPYAIGIICLVMSFVITVQIKSVRRNTAMSSADTVRITALQTRLQNETERYIAQVEETNRYKEEVQEWRKKAMDSSETSAVHLKQLNHAENLAGLTDVTGPGVIVVMRDNPEKREYFLVSEDDIVHYSDLLFVANELWAAGAEAVSINGERIIARSEIRCVGNSIMINARRQTPPFEIKAIGNSKTLEDGLLFPGGVVDQILQFYPIDVTIEKVASLEIPAYKGIPNFEYAVPITKK